MNHVAMSSTGTLIADEATIDLLKHLCAGDEAALGDGAPEAPMEPQPERKPVIDVDCLRDDDEGVLRSIGGSHSDVFNRKIINEVALACARINDPKFETVAREVAAALRDIGPRDALEGMRAARILAAHAAAMDAYALARAMKPGPFQDVMFDRADRASRTADLLTEGLERARGAGAKVIAELVERVIVTPDRT